MIRDIKTVYRRNSATLVQDAVGVAALVVMLLVGLYAPVSF